MTTNSQNPLFWQNLDLFLRWAFSPCRRTREVLRYLHRITATSLEIVISAPATISLELGTTNNIKEIGLDRAPLSLLLSCSVRITG